MFLLLSIGLPLASEFTSLDEPTKVSDVATAAESDLKGEESPETRHES
jgi:hypothetical protein